MPKRNKAKLHPVLFVLVILLPLIDFGLYIRHVLQGKNIALFNPKGVISSQQRGLIVLTSTVLFLVVIPTLLFLYFTAWKYRESNNKASHDPEPRHSNSQVFVIWGIPTVVMLSLVGVMAPATYRLVPQKAIASSAQPLTIEVISLRWKWLFIYPDQDVAAVNFVQLPVNTPVTFEMTADETPMSSFWIPNLGGQLYTMTEHVNRLNLMATIPGDYRGRTAEINGAGFAGMEFTAEASSADGFNQWVQHVQQSPRVLDTTTYQSLLKPSTYNQAAYYSSPDPTLFAKVISKYEGPGGHHH